MINVLIIPHVEKSGRGKNTVTQPVKCAIITLGQYRKEHFMDILWKDRKRTFLGLPLSFTKYTLSEKCLYICTGFLNTTEDEIRLYRIIDITLHRTLGQRILGIGSIVCHSSDETMKKFEIKNIKKPRQTKELLSDLIEQQRHANRVFNRENIAVDDNNYDEAEDIDPETADEM